MPLAKRTKIVCTIGPASESKAIITKLIKAGMNVARLNFSHGTYENHALLVKNLRAAAEAEGEYLAILADLQGPRLRVGNLPQEGVKLENGKTVVINPKTLEYKKNEIPVEYPLFKDDIKISDRLLLDDGKIELKVRSYKGELVEAEVVHGGTLLPHKGINFPDSQLSISSLTEKDKADLKFILGQNVDFVALSFVRTAKDVLDLRFLIKQYEKELGIKNGPPILIISKIEMREAINNLDEIIDVTDGIMVARGDLGLELPAEEVPLWQKKMIQKCLAVAKPVIVATQMLDSMVHNVRPTRAEVSDVANAVIDHTDAVMLSAETASGEFPVETVTTMAKIAMKTEASTFDDLEIKPSGKKNEPLDDAISELARLAADKLGAKAILAASISGASGRHISRFRPELPIYVPTDTDRVCHQLNLSWGIRPFILPSCRTIEELVERSMGYLKKNKELKKGDRVILVAGEPVGQAGNVNLVEVREVK